MLKRAAPEGVIQRNIDEPLVSGEYANVTPEDEIQGPLEDSILAAIAKTERDCQRENSVPTPGRYTRSVMHEIEKHQPLSVPSLEWRRLVQEAAALREGIRENEGITEAARRRRDVVERILDDIRDLVQSANLEDRQTELFRDLVEILERRK